MILSHKTLWRGTGTAGKQASQQHIGPPAPRRCTPLFTRLLDTPDAAIVALNVAVGVASTCLIALLTEKWFGQAAAVFAAILYACWPSQIQFTTVLASELLNNFLGLLCLAVWYGGWVWPWRMSACGVLFAAATYVRPTALLLPILLSFRDILVDRSAILRRSFGLVIVAAVMALLIAPWSIRNTRAFGQFVSCRRMPDLFFGWVTTRPVHWNISNCRKTSSAV